MIKYRQWHKDGKPVPAWYYWGYLTVEEYKGTFSEPLDNGEPSFAFIGKENAEGREIYVGDLFRLSKTSNSIAEVYFDKRSAGYRVRVNGEMQFDKTYPITWILREQVIGNVHENPELLKRK